LGVKHEQLLQHSADVAIYLSANGERFEVAGCLGNKCTLRNPRNLSPCNATLVIVIDGEERQIQVYLRNGISQNSNEIEFDPISSSSTLIKEK
jgi:hypothetical protein